MLKSDGGGGERLGAEGFTLVAAGTGLWGLQIAASAYCALIERCHRAVYLCKCSLKDGFEHRGSNFGTYFKTWSSIQTKIKKGK